MKDKLSHLTYREAFRLLGENGQALIRDGGAYPIDIDEQVTFTADRFVLSFDPAKVTLILEEKMILGLAAPPPERIPMEALSEAELVRQARVQR